MPIEKLTREQLALVSLTDRVPVEYVAFLQRMLPGDGGRAIVAREGVTRQAIKNRLNAAADELGIQLVYLPCPPEEVVFEAVRVSGGPVGHQHTDQPEETVVKPSPATDLASLVFNEL